MTSLIIYLLESSAVLAFFYLLYVLVLRKETFFNLNRYFLLGILVFSLLFPFLSFDINPAKMALVEQSVGEISKARMSYHDLMESWDFEGSNGPDLAEEVITYEAVNAWDWKQISLISILIIYAIGVVTCLSRTIWTIQWIRGLIRSSLREKRDGMTVVITSKPISPFSFLKYVFVHDSLAATPEFDQILAHERTHIDEKHSYDLIFVQLLAAFFWFNPVIWRLIKSLKTAHEYIADKKMMNAGYSLVEYQTLLLRQLISNQSYGLVHNFNLTFIKKRITMMTNNKSGWLGKMKVVLALSATLVFSVTIVQCNSAMEENNPVVKDEISTEGSDDFTYARWKDNVDIVAEDLKNTLDLKIVKSKIYLQGEEVSMEDLPDRLSDMSDQSDKMILTKVHESEKIGFVQKVLAEFENAGMRKVLFEGRSLDGKEPSYMVNFVKGGLPNKTEILDNDIPYFLVNADPSILVNDISAELSDFVSEQVKSGRTDYVVVIEHSDSSTFAEYVVAKNQVMGTFLSIYQQKSREQFDKEFFDLENEMRRQISKNRPMSFIFNNVDK